MLEEELKAMHPDMGAIEAYARKDTEYATRVSELDAATAQRDEVCAWALLLDPGELESIVC